MRLPDDPSKYTNRWKWLEVASVVPGQNKIARDTRRLYQVSEIPDWALSKGNLGVYTSVYHFNSQEIENSTRMASLYFDLDSADPHVSHQDTIKLYEYFAEFVPQTGLQVYFSGSKGFHVEVEALCLNISPSNDLDDIFRFIATRLRDELELETLDFAVYDKRRMWRIPNSMHQKTGLYKRYLKPSEITSKLEKIMDLAQAPSAYQIPEQELDFNANSWYREMVYDWEASKNPKSHMSELENFLNNGGKSINISEEKVFTPINLMEGCPLVAKLWKKAEEKHHLEHEERLFLCSLLTYTDEAIYEYLHPILSNTTDYRFEKTQAHVEDWVARRERGIGGRPFTCRKVKELGMECSGCCELEPKHKSVTKGNKVIFLENEYSDPSPIRFAYNYSKENK